jgi:hypothetical protein
LSPVIPAIAASRIHLAVRICLFPWFWCKRSWRCLNAFAIVYALIGGRAYGFYELGRSAIALQGLNCLACLVNETEYHGNMLNVQTARIWWIVPTSICIFHWIG